VLAQWIELFKANPYNIDSESLWKKITLKKHVDIGLS
jgi:hypothetical protein